MMRESRFSAQGDRVGHRGTPQIIPTGTGWDMRNPAEWRDSNLTAEL